MPIEQKIKIEILLMGLVGIGLWGVTRFPQGQRGGHQRRRGERGGWPRRNWGEVQSGRGLRIFRNVIAKVSGSERDSLSEPLGGSLSTTL